MLSETIRCNVLWTLLAVFAVCLFSDHAFAQDGEANELPTVEQPDTTTEEITNESTGEAAATAETPAPNPTKSIFEQDFGEALSTIWNATLFNAGGTEIKLNQIIIALLVAVIGLWLAKLFTGFVTGRLVRVRKVNETVAFTIGKVIYYIAATVVLLIAMQVAGIPTTVFTVLGGALAIGVGFGAQNLFNNLISGVIILTEKPIRRKDIVVIDDMEGQVAEIGNRRTRIRTGDGVDVLVPNSKFLENNVINWTLYDSKIRGWVEVGVAYGSPVKQVRDLLQLAAGEHEKIRSSPEPEVLFTAFGNNTLNFSVCFWTEVAQPMDLRRIESDLRFRIDELFHEHNITIAFPQRDVHLETMRPLEVRMVKDGGTAHQTETK
ncbi:MAG: mechanosensitive ion channel domain-containing protein [Planctomycetota bacterium]